MTVPLINPGNRRPLRRDGDRLVDDRGASFPLVRGISPHRISAVKEMFRCTEASVTFAGMVQIENMSVAVVRAIKQ